MTVTRSVTRMTYGVLPPIEAIRRAFEQQGIEVYRVRAGISPMFRGTSYVLAPYASDKFDPDELYVLIEHLTRCWEAGNEEAGADASVILQTLGIEWV